jgi:hypothetical protein
MAKTKLEIIANEARMNLKVRNTFTGNSESEQYSRTHTRAVSDEETPIRGKGTGKELDTRAGGDSYDINGHASVPGSGRNGNIRVNLYNENNQYQRPTMDGDFGDV